MSLRRAARQGLRLSRAERLRQVHDHPDAHGTARARPPGRPRGFGGLDVVRDTESLEAPPRLHEPEVLALPRPDASKKTSASSGRSTASSRAARGARSTPWRSAWLRAAPAHPHRRALDRAAAARGAGGGAPPRAGAPLSRRAHRRRRPAGPARVLGPDLRARRGPRHDRPRHDALHGRGGAVRPPGVHPRRRADRRGHAARAEGGPARAGSSRSCRRAIPSPRSRGCGAMPRSRTRTSSACACARSAGRGREADARRLVAPLGTAVPAEPSLEDVFVSLARRQRRAPKEAVAS